MSSSVFVRIVRFLGGESGERKEWSKKLKSSTFCKKRGILISLAIASAYIPTISKGQ